MLRALAQLGKLALATAAVMTIQRADGAAQNAATPAPSSAASAAAVDEHPRAVPAVRTRVQQVRDTVARPFDGFMLPEMWRDSIVRVATAQVGRRYRFGGTTPQRGFDCSGLVRWVLSNVDIPAPRTAYLQATVGEPVNPSDLLPGDLVVFGPDSVSHIGIYIGNGSFVHASSVAGRVVISRIDRKPSKLIKPLHGARRLKALHPTPFHQGILTTASR